MHATIVAICTLECVRAATFVTARVGSSRLSGKVLSDIGGRPALDRLVERVSLARFPELVVLCTTTEPEDDVLEAAGTRLGIEVHRGSVEDILDRWHSAAQRFDVDLVVNCDADDVFCDPVHIDRVFQRHVETAADYITCVGLPFGTAPTGMSAEALRRICAAKVDTNTEGQGRFFADPEFASTAEVKAPDSLLLESARMTLDYPEDLEFFRAVAAELDRPGEVFSLQEIVDLLRNRPDIVAINAGRQAEYWERFRAKYPPVELRR